MRARAAATNSKLSCVASRVYKKELGVEIVVFLVCVRGLDSDSNTTDCGFARESVTADTFARCPGVLANAGMTPPHCVLAKGGRERNLVSVELASFIAGNHGERFRCICSRSIQATVHGYISCIRFRIYSFANYYYYTTNLIIIIRISTICH